MNKDKIIEIIEQIQNKNSGFLGHNEYNLHVRLDIVDFLFKNYNITKKPECPECGRVGIDLSNQPKKEFYCSDCSIHFNL